MGRGGKCKGLLNEVPPRFLNKLKQKYETAQNRERIYNGTITIVNSNNFFFK